MVRLAVFMAMVGECSFWKIWVKTPTQPNLLDPFCILSNHRNILVSKSVLSSYLVTQERLSLIVLSSFIIAPINFQVMLYIIWYSCKYIYICVYFQAMVEPRRRSWWWVCARHVQKTDAPGARATGRSRGFRGWIQSAVCWILPSESTIAPKPTSGHSFVSTLYSCQISDLKQISWFYILKLRTSSTVHVSI